jgi:hypothetical protein
MVVRAVLQRVPDFLADRRPPGSRITRTTCPPTQRPGQQLDLRRFPAPFGPLECDEEPAHKPSEANCSR